MQGGRKRRQTVVINIEIRQSEIIECGGIVEQSIPFRRICGRSIIFVVVDNKVVVVDDVVVVVVVVIHQRKIDGFVRDRQGKGRWYHHHVISIRTGHGRIPEPETHGGSDGGHVEMMIEIGGGSCKTIEEARASVRVDGSITVDKVEIMIRIVTKSTIVVVKSISVVQPFGQGGGPQDREDRIVRELIEIERRFG